MQELDIKRGHFSSIDGRVKDMMQEIFGNVKEEGGWLVSEYGAMKPIKVQLKGKKAVLVEINTVSDVDEQTAIDTIKAKNRFLEELTGYNAKERAKKLQEKAKKGKL